MQKVSDDWKLNQQQTFVNESYIKITLGFNDPEASENATAFDNGSAFYGNTPQVVSEVEKNFPPYATLEQNLWLLDGQRKILPTENFGDAGFISGLISKEDCSFGTNPIVSINFPKVFSTLLPGLTIVWSNTYGECPESFKVTTYNGDEEVNSTTITGNKDIQSVVWFDITNFNRIDIEVLRWCLPYHRARIRHIFIGVDREYTKRDITEFKHESEVDPIGSSLHSSVVDFSVDNTSNEYDPNNETGLSKYLMERQEISVKYGFKINDDIEWLDCGVFYLSQWSAPQNGLVAKFTASSLLEFMTATFIKGLYRPNGISLYDLALEVLTEAKLPLNADGSVKWVLDESLKNIITYAPLPLISQAECLQYIAQAGCCVLLCDRKGNLHIEPIENVESEDYTISRFNAYSYPEIDLQKPLSYVEVKSYNYFVSEDDKDWEIFSGTLNIEGTKTITVSYSNPAVNARATVTDGTLIGATYYTNAAVLTIAAAGDVQVSIIGDILSESRSDYVVNNAESGVEQTVANPLITSPLHALLVGTWVREWLKNRRKISAEWRADPRLDATDIIGVENKFNTNKVRVSSVSITYTGAFKGKITGRTL